METAIVVMALLVAPASALVGVAAGAVFTYRLMRGQPPVPPLPRKARVIDEEQSTPEPRRHPPTVRA